MDVFEAIEKRHSYRAVYTDDPVSRSDLQKIVQAGIQAPSGCNVQTTSFVIIDDAVKIQDIAKLLGKDFVLSCKAIIACIATHPPIYHGMSFGAEDCAAAVENMLLAITALGYATVWLDGCLRLEGRERKIAEMLGVPDDAEVRILLPVGVPAKQWKQMEKKPFEERAGFNDYADIRKA